jgi:hypothetical protein
MSEHLRLASSPASSSPGRLPSISRPDWPWAARSYSQRSQQSSPHPSNSTVQGSSLHSGWDPRASVSSSNSGINQNTFSGSHQVRHTKPPKPPSSSSMGFPLGETTRQWSFTVNFSHVRNHIQAHLPYLIPSRDLSGLSVTFPSSEAL